MAHIAGVSVTDSDAWWIVDRLFAIGRADDVTTALTLELGIQAGADVNWLTPAQEAAVMLVLDNPPDGLLELRHKLARDHHDQT